MKVFSNLYYSKSVLAYLLLPFALVYKLIISIRHWCYQKNIFKSYKAPVPVIVVGNITLGGTGKTPLTIALVELLKSKGYKPGVVSRGYGNKQKHFPYILSKKSTAVSAGDEPLLIYRRTHSPVVIDPDRSRAAKFLLANYDCNVIISDDGLQHYALQRDIEIVVIDAQRKFGNGLLFPAGPLREPQSRLKQVDFIIYNGTVTQPTIAFVMKLLPGLIRSVPTDEVLKDFKTLNNNELIAIAGIGNPNRFFQTLEILGLHFKKQAMPDHYNYTEADFANDQYYIMTEKDAVKCHAFGNDKMYYLTIDAVLSDDFKELLLQKLRDCGEQVQSIGEN